MSETNEQSVHVYYDLLQGGAASFDEDRLRAILAPDLAFEGPIAGHRVGAEMFIRGVAGFAQTMRHLTMLQMLDAVDETAALYDADMPGGTVRFAEFFQATDGTLRSLRVLFDPAAYRARGGR